MQRCHPQNMARFFMIMVGECVLVRIDDSSICPLSNYKSVLLARRTTALETVRILLAMCRVVNADESQFKLFINEDGRDFIELPSEVCTADIYSKLSPGQKLTLRRLD